MLVVNDRISVPLRELQFTFARSSGPGGQNVNKVSSKATLRWAVSTTSSIPAEVRDRFLARFCRRITKDGDLVLSSQRFRDQGRNVADCLAKLRELLLEIARPAKKRKPTRRTRASVERRLQGKRHLSRKKQRRRGPKAEE